MQSTIDYSIKEGEKVIADIKTEVSGSTGGLGAALRAAQKKTNEILTEVVERHRAAAGAGDEKDAEHDDDGEEEGDEDDDEPGSKKLKL